MMNEARRLAHEANNLLIRLDNHKKALYAAQIKEGCGDGYAPILQQQTQTRRVMKQAARRLWRRLGIAE